MLAPPWGQVLAQIPELELALGPAQEPEPAVAVVLLVEVARMTVAEAAKRQLGEVDSIHILAGWHDRSAVVGAQAHTFRHKQGPEVVATSIPDCPEIQNIRLHPCLPIDLPGVANTQDLWMEQIQYLAAGFAVPAADCSAQERIQALRLAAAANW